MASIKRLTKLLSYAVKRGNFDRVKQLTAEGTDYKAVDNSGLTFLHLAAQGDNLDLVKYFVDKGIDINAKTNDGSICILLLR